MERRPSGFRTAMEQASDISSLNSREYLEPRSAEGSLYYELYGMADCGLGRTVNEDNLYMDGIYMKSFQFAHYSKGIRTQGDNAVFALCGPKLGAPVTGEQSAMKVMAELDRIRPQLCSWTALQGGQILQNFAQSNVPGSWEQNLAFGAVYVTPGGVAALSTGGIGIYRLKGKRLVPCGCCMENSVCLLGGPLRYGAELIKRKKEEVYVLCSPTVVHEFALETLEEIVCVNSPEEAVRRIMDKSVTMCRGANTSMMVVRVTSAAKRKGSF